MININEFLVKGNTKLEKYEIYKCSWVILGKKTVQYFVYVTTEEAIKKLFNNTGIKKDNMYNVIKYFKVGENELFIRPDKNGKVFTVAAHINKCTYEDTGKFITRDEFNYDYWKEQNWI